MYASAAAASSARGERRSTIFPSRRRTVVARTCMSPPCVAWAIHRDREDDDNAGDDLLDPVRQAHARTAVLDHGHQERADQRAQDRPLAARERAAADDHRRDDAELEPGGAGGV